MKICITAKKEDFSSEVDPRFGRAACFIIVDSETGQFSAEQNSAVNASGGAGVQASQWVAEQKVSVVLTGNVGPNAFKVLEAAKIDVITGVEGTVDEAFRNFKEGKYKDQKTDGPTVPGK